ncbi:cation:proton antiporter [Polyangium jinanense]|uniref:Cation:proton antiporter n=1 Tax=Polyangium jinanense TaxID=2829994 RepID=A0A9X3XAN8_9BACT|nr:cation:proton antiporter [Polyangium jinanense]MDC3961700.1 cation:proton antiporter [Polyangium jinanense]MDC3983913.1 cation:proton antiporter [Polyangium jinanense]MDC3987252.1 cation:proton antiporter [Polyangium jinanense]
MIRAALVLALVAGISFAARSFLPADATITGSGAALAFGFLLIAAMQTGHIFHDLRLPHLTGFILCGAIFGPEVLRLITPSMLGDLTLVKKVAVGLIALNAGCELNFARLRPKIRSIGLVSIFGLLTEFVLLFGLFAFVLKRIDFTADMTSAQRLAVALICATVLCALSPAVVMGILKETRAVGPLSEMCLSIVVLADLAVVIAFSFTESVARAVFPPEAAASGAGGHSIFGALAVHIFGSIATGIAVGLISALYIRRVGQRIGLFVFAVLFVVAEIGGALHLDPLLVGLSAGLFLENISPVSGHEVIHETEVAAMPTFAVFFAVVGAEVHLHAFFTVAPYAAMAALTRAAGIYAGARFGARVAKVDPEVAARIPFGMFPQAGVAIGLANLVANSFKPWGQAASTLILGTIVINEMLGPVLFRIALARAGEISKKREASLLDLPSHAPTPEADVEAT